MELVHKHQRTNHTVPALELRQIRWRRKEKEGDEEREGRKTAKKLRKFIKAKEENPHLKANNHKMPPIDICKDNQIARAPPAPAGLGDAVSSSN